MFDSLVAKLPDGAAASLRSLLDRVGGPRALAMHVLFWGLLAGALWAIVEPLWVGAIPPMTDFGGHAAMADVWARLEDVELYQEMFERRSGLIPNVMAARFVGWLHPWVETLTAMRLFLTLVMVGTVVGLLGILHTFERSRWLVFLALPFLWNGSMHWGMVNYLAAFPCFFGAIALARQTGRTGDWRYGLGLAVVCALCFFMHGLGAPFTFGAAAFALVVSLHRWRDALYLLGFLPGVGLWMRWKSQASGRQGLPGGGLFEILSEHGEWFEPIKVFEQFLHHALDPVKASEDTVLLAIVLGLWLLAMGLSSKNGESREEDGDDTSEDTSTSDEDAPLWKEAWHRLRHGAARLYAEAREHALLLIVVCLGIASAIFPSYIVNTNVNTRVMHLFVLTAALLPRLPKRSWLATATIAGAVVASFWFGDYMERKVRVFHRQETASLVELMEEIPEQQRVECLGVRGGTQPVFRGRPLDLNCPALIHLRRSGVGGFGFPSTGFNPVTFADGAGYPTLRHQWFGDIGRVQQWDYVVIRSDHRRPPEKLATRVARSGTKDEKATEWTLYRIVTSELPTDHHAVVGGEGGNDFRWNCPDGRVLAGVDGALAPGAGFIGTLRPVCRRIVEAEEELAVEGGELEGPELGTIDGHDPFRIRCPKGTFVLGFEGRAEKFVDQLQLTCGRVERGSEEENGGFRVERTDRSERVGSKGGTPYEIACKEGQVVRGVRGRNGSFVDAVGFNCVDVERLVDEEPK